MMRFETFIDMVGNEEFIDTVGSDWMARLDERARAGLRHQLVRWVADGRLVKLRRGLYLLAPPYRALPHPFVIANHLAPMSYVSLESALAFHGIIADDPPTVTSVAGSRRAQIRHGETVLDFRELSERLRFGWEVERIGRDASARVAVPEKAALDLAHLHRGSTGKGFWMGLRIVRPDLLDARRLLFLAEQSGYPRLRFAAYVFGNLQRAWTRHHRCW